METKLKEAIQGLLNKVNRVTCPHRHGQKVPRKDLDGLANRQIDFEKIFKTYKEESATVLYAIQDKESGDFVKTFQQYICGDVEWYMSHYGYWSTVQKHGAVSVLKAIKEAPSWINKYNENIENLKIVKITTIASEAE